MLALPLLWTFSSALSAGELSEVRDGVQLDLSLPDLQGQTHSLDEFRGRVVLLNFWASWCTACLVEMPAILGLQQALKDRPFAVVAVNVGETPSEVRSMIKRLKLDFQVLLDRDRAVFKGWDITVLPTSYVLDADGRLRLLGRGPLEWDRQDIVDEISRLFPDTEWQDGRLP